MTSSRAATKKKSDGRNKGALMANGGVTVGAVEIHVEALNKSEINIA